MKRWIYRAQLTRDGEGTAAADGLDSQIAKRLTAEGELMTIAAFKWKRHLFVYYECIGRTIEPEEMFGSWSGLLGDWPGQDEPRQWIPMIDVFHFNEPASVEHWRRKSPVERRAGRVAHLRPEMMSSYIS